ncbi:MAG TPA: glycosyltransferase family 2 protein [Verrucomicrobiae bacterium]|nr:glycosyltransferase family 2 protein [Verrucomicrobiae bacterium]
MTDVSVIILTRNTCEMTRAAIQSVLDSRDDLRKEILVVDNGSTDDTPRKLPRDFPQIKFLRSERNLGFAAGCNLAAKNATGEFLLLLNSDSLPAPDAMAKTIEFMRANPNCAVAGAQLLNLNGSRQNSIANFPTLATELLSKSLLRRIWKNKFPGKEQKFSTPVDVESVVGAFMLARKKVWDEFGGLDERYFFFLEETDFCLQARQKNYRVVHLPNVCVTHGQGQTAKQVSTAARIEYWRSRYIYFAKNHGIGTRILLRAGLFIRLFFDWLVAALLAFVTFGQSARWRSRLRLCSALIGWHLRGCDNESGLPRE